MKSKVQKLLLLIGIFISVLLISNISNASGLRLKKLNYDVELNADGSADVTETWNISIEDTNTLFKTFEVDKTKYKEITDVTVSEIKSNGTIVNFDKINQYKYHVDKNCYYAMMYNGKFEIAWGAHAEDTTRTYKISYKIVDGVKNYNDCSEFYWQFISIESEIPANKVTGTIKLPSSVSNKEDLKVWAHGPLNGNIEIKSNNEVYFEVEDLKSNTMLEARVVTPTNIFDKNINISNTNKLNSILSQEQKWADEANAKREQIQKQQRMTRIVLIAIAIIINIVGIIVGIVIIKKIIKYRKELKNTHKIEAEQKLEYFRDIPDENSTPAQAAFLYYFRNSNFDTYITKIISATMLDLCMKKYIEFEIEADKKDNIKVIVNDKSKEALSEDEQSIYNLLSVVKNVETKSFTMKEFEKYVKNHAESVQKIFSRIKKAATNEQITKNNYDTNLREKYNKWIGKGVSYIFLAIFTSIFAITITIPSIVASVYCFKIAGKYNTLTQKGENEKEKWKALKKYMEEFSMMKDKTVPELVLWEKYLVYATAFGIADKVLKQLKVIYPEITDVEYMTSHGYTYMYLMYSNNLGTSFISSIDRAVTNSYYSASNYSSGSGSGGGFSGGGGFGGGGGRNGRKIK